MKGTFWKSFMSYLYVQVDFITTADIGEISPRFQVGSPCFWIAFVCLLSYALSNSTFIKHLNQIGKSCKVK